jgi:hypothetical protein
MSSEHNQPVFTYHTRVSVTPEQDQMLRGYTSLFGRVERTLYADMQKGKDASELKSAYLARFEITARQFNAVRIQLQGKVKAMREQLPGLIDNLKTRIRKAKKTIAKLAKLIPGSEKLHQKRRRLGNLQQGFEKLQNDRKSGRTHICFGSKKLFRAQFHLEENGCESHDQWHRTFTQARSKQFFILGSKDETAGCQGCIAIRDAEGRYMLRVRLPNSAGGKACRHQRSSVSLRASAVRGVVGLQPGLSCTVLFAMGRAGGYWFLRKRRP